MKQLKFFKTKCVEWVLCLLMYCFNLVVSHIPTSNVDTLRRKGETNIDRARFNWRLAPRGVLYLTFHHKLPRKSGRARDMKSHKRHQQGEQKKGHLWHHIVVLNRFAFVPPFNVMIIGVGLNCENWDLRVRCRRKKAAKCTHINLCDNNAMMVAFYVLCKEKGRKLKPS